MSRFQEQKKRLASLSSNRNWLQALRDEITSVEVAKCSSNAFLALLNRPEARWQAAYGLGLCLPLMANENMESARVFMRRLMWSLNEESGNLGWGIPEAMACILAACTPLADEYARIFVSYGYETGRDDNFLDHGPLRRGVYWGIGHIAGTNARHVLPALPHLIKALSDEDAVICAYAAWAMQQLEEAVPAGTEGQTHELWQKALDGLFEQIRKRRERKQDGMIVEYFDGEAILHRTLADVLAQSLQAVAGRK